MISNYDRSWWIGASDTRFVMMNQNTASYQKWWQVKTGQIDALFGGNEYTRAGDKFEHPILEALNPFIRQDLQIQYEPLRLRVNYDGDFDGMIHEVKTYRGDKTFEVTKAYWQQAQVEAYVYQMLFDDFKGIEIVAYPLSVEDYNSDRPPVVDRDRIEHYEISYDKHWIKGEYLPTLKPQVRQMRRAMRKRGIDQWD